MTRRLCLISALWLGLAAPVAAQINGGSPIYTFSPNTVISSTEVNANFAALFSDALNRTGGTFTGALNGVDATFTGLFTVDELVGTTGSFDTLTVDTLTVNTTATLPDATAIGAVSATELGYVNGVTSSIQDQLNDLSSSIGGISVTGRIVQIVSATYNTAVVSATSSTYVASGLTATITPTSATSILVVLTSQPVYVGVNTVSGWQLQRDNNPVVQQYYGWDGGFNAMFVYRATAASTSATVFKTMFNRNSGSASVCANIGTGGAACTDVAPSTAWMLILEINQ